MFFGCVFFFFKQKTAYEMRISDWSSDVCSSDLFEDRLFLGSVDRGGQSGFRIVDKNAVIVATALEDFDVQGFHASFRCSHWVRQHCRGAGFEVQPLDRKSVV